MDSFNSYTVKVYNSDTQNCYEFTMHGFSENEIMSRANATINEYCQVTEIIRNY